MYVILLIYGLVLLLFISTLNKTMLNQNLLELLYVYIVILLL